MIFLVDAANRSHFATDLAVMHRQRKAVFVDRVGWNLPVRGEQEIDPYDVREDTLYLLAKKELDGPLRASARLLSTTGSHLMCDLFSTADREAMPRGPTVLEVSRFCIAPGIEASNHRRALLWQIICGVIETGLLYGIAEVIFAAGRPLLPLALNCGWDVRTLARRAITQNDEVTAVSAKITTAGLRRVREIYDVPAPVIRFHAPAPAYSSTYFDTHSQLHRTTVSPVGAMRASPAVDESPLP